MKQATVALDMDGCLVDFNPVILDRLREEGVGDFEYDDVTRFQYKDCLGPEADDVAWEIIKSEDLYDELDPEPGALEAVEHLRGMVGRVIVVSSPVEGHAGSKIRWLLRHGFDRKDVVLASDKALAGAKADVLLDDAIHNLEAFPGRVIVMDRPWNRHLEGDFPRAEGWRDVPRLVRETLRQETALEEAGRLVDGPRQQAYGHPIENFRVIAGVWSALLGHEIPVWAVPRMMIGLKLARDFSGTRKRDNVVDVAGYARTAEMVEDRLKEEDPDEPRLG